MPKTKKTNKLKQLFASKRRSSNRLSTDCRSSIVAANEVDPKYLPVVVIEKYSDLSGLSYEEVIDVNLGNNNNEQPQGNEELHNVHEKSPTSSVDDLQKIHQLIAEATKKLTDVSVLIRDLLNKKQE